jgi:hypothetical protein
MGEQSRQAPAAVVDGRPVTWRIIESEYQAGNHLVNGGPDVGLFWASNIQDTSQAARKPIEHALAIIREYEGGMSKHFGEILAKKGTESPLSGLSR